MGADEGLLERNELLLAPWDSVGKRTLLDAATGLVLGSSQVRPKRGWRRLTRSVVEVREQQDESLLYTVRRCWSLFPWFEVWDADDQVLGWHGGPLLLDRGGRRFALRANESDADTTNYVEENGKIVAWLTRDKDNVRLTFSVEVASDPFAKMLLLAAALRW